MLAATHVASTAEASFAASSAYVELSSLYPSCSAVPSHHGHRGRGPVPLLPDPLPPAACDLGRDLQGSFLFSQDGLSHRSAPLVPQLLHGEHPRMAHWAPRFANAVQRLWPAVEESTSPASRPPHQQAHRPHRQAAGHQAQGVSSEKRADCLLRQAVSHQRLITHHKASV